MRTLRQGRGYSFEIKLVAEFNEGDWHCRRLGGSSSGLPDLIITNNKESILWSVECKSRTSKDIHDKEGKISVIPPIQIQRCFSMFDMFSLYKNKSVLFMFKFNIKKPRTAVFHYFKVYRMRNVKSVTCSREGRLTHTKEEQNKDSNIDYVQYYTIDKLKNDERTEEDTHFEYGRKLGQKCIGCSCLCRWNHPENCCGCSCSFCGFH